MSVQKILVPAGIGLALLHAAFAPSQAGAQGVAGIPLLNFDQASRNQTELGSEYRIDALSSFEPRWLLVTSEGNAFARLTFKRLRLHESRPRLQVALWGEIERRRPLPDRLVRTARGISINLSSTCKSVVHVVLAGADGKPVASSNLEIGTERSRYTINADMDAVTTVIFEFDTVYAASNCGTVSFDIDDLSLDNGSNVPFTPPEEDPEFLDWLARSSFNFFDWNFVQTGADEGVVLERQDQADQVSVSGQGYAIAIYIVGTERGYIERSEAHRRVASIVNWLHRQDWEEGVHGWHGFPYHWYKTDKSPHWPAVSTVDWAMLAAGLRVARQYFDDDPALVASISEILARPQWDRAVGPEGRIGMGFHADDGALDPYSWGLAFSEETELVYLEALASNSASEHLLRQVRRPSRFGLCPSWFGSGFTYNWLQLWTGPLPYLMENSRRAYALDLRSNIQAFGRPLIGLTAAATMTAVDEDGFFVSPLYFSNQGAAAHLTTNQDEVVQIAPAPYGAALALPFIRSDAIRALRAYVELGYYSEYLGLPDSILLGGLPDGVGGVPSYRHLDLNIGAFGIALDQSGDGIIGRLYRADPQIRSALEAWERQSTADFKDCVE